MKLRKNVELKSFQWIGRRLPRRGRDRRQENISYYSAFKFGEIEGRVGDYMLISNVDSLDPESVEGCDIAKILELYELADEDDSHRAVVLWYSRPQQLPKKFANHQMPFPPFDNECEVVEDKRNFDCDIDMETVFRKCQVVQAMPEEVPKEVIDNYGWVNVPLFVARFQFSSRKGKEAIDILPMSLDNIDPPVEIDSESSSSSTMPSRSKKKKSSHSASLGQIKNGGMEGKDGGANERSDSPEIATTGGEIRGRNSSRKNSNLGSSPDVQQKSSSKTTDSPKRSRKQSVGMQLKHDVNGGASSPVIEAKGSQKGSSKKVKSQEKECSTTTKGNMKALGVRKLKDGDISGLLDDDFDDGDKVEGSSDSDSASDNEVTSSPGRASYTSSVVGDSPKLKLKRIAAEPIDSMKRTRLLATPTRATKSSFDMKSVEKSPLLKTPSRSSSKKMLKKSLIGEDEKGSDAQKTPTTPHLSRSLMTPKSTGSIKSISARKRLQLLSDVGQNRGSGVAERGRHAGPITTPSSPLEEARARLHVSCVPKSLPCRDKEFSSIYSFVEDKILDGVGGCMYICGVPGTGKTATVREVVKKLQEASSNGEIPAFEFAEINGMRVTEPRRAYSEMLRVLTGRAGVSPDEARELLDNRFSKPAPRRLPTLLLVDELDLLCTRRQDVVYNLMDWPNRDQSRLIVITIANTMDLPERVLMSKVCSRMGLTRLTFHPYSFQQLQEIVTSRMEGLKAFDPDAVQLVARKVAAVSGDARRALDICRRATECAESEMLAEKKTSHQSPARKKITKAMKSVVVTMKHVDQALSEMISSSKAKAIQSCSRLEKVFLQAVASEVERTGVEEAAFERVHSVVGTLCTYSGFRRPTVSESMGVCWRLGSLRLLLTEASSRADILQRVMLNVDVDSVHYALKAQNQKNG